MSKRKLPADHSAGSSVIIILLQQPLQSLQLALALQEQKHFQRFYRIFLMQFLFFCPAEDKEHDQ